MMVRNNLWNHHSKDAEPVVQNKMCGVNLVFQILVMGGKIGLSTLYYTYSISFLFSSFACCWKLCSNKAVHYYSVTHYHI